ncbi:MAG: ZIP family metal transporter [Parcubacteria group bacterium]|nr:ZIP family metal transporter [Parcubacteria group bacterium]
MALPLISALASVIIVSLISVVGIVTLSFREDFLRKIIFVLVSLAAGAMFGDVFLHLLPELYTASGAPVSAPLTVLAGILMFFILEKFLRWRHLHAENGTEDMRHVGYMNIAADGVHNLIDGMLIGAAYLVSIPVGIATTVAVILHEIPQEIGDFGVLVHSGFSTRRALLFNSFSGAFAILGLLISLFAGSQTSTFSTTMLALTAGGFIYIAGSDLLPELHKERAPARSLLQLIALGLGITLMLLLTSLD